MFTLPTANTGSGGGGGRPDVGSIGPGAGASGRVIVVIG
jgi:hypothetical protein